MGNASTKIGILIAEGVKFNYRTFADFGAGGYPSAYTPEWLTWTTRVGSAVKELFAKTSAPTRILQSAQLVQLLGNGEDSFRQAKAFYMGALEAAKKILDEDTFDELLATTRAVAPRDLTNKVFIVHGRDDAAKAELEIILAEMGLEPVVLHRQADGGNTVIEKFEKHADVGFAFILLTPDEVAYLASEEAKPDAEREKERRARPNVIFEFGYFVGRLGRARTCCLYRGNVVLPSDLGGLVYKRFDRSVEEVAYGIQKELKAAGYSLK
ncbi:nucleotide-binding protein [Mesorhizobium sp. AR02]|uniref:nucleotide-binding protein n=1 Tax=Mesorhizobium sp. AR02 TaxID=2865837 RepID=UPI00215EE601|nr:nucleotide-binding protein [Mesorhizobium sp. AR02]UVK56342.1 nucleotide-binding protein [Mesorhizobium sp. AR02]